ncbi:PAS domain S-box protein [Nordella sp. HKS 07]|uniref:PAS domain-containing sensor histidine kinase n=1 Tax=Nordella sp. HKS 07 TaxID=2712222 RepID=UPI0013E1A38C|nr:ATP-binding protein [Nordella sp. HKS 07]QIG49872.1 PAS domain S-box protein [Nordella sp. HKS 07]
MHRTRCEAGKSNRDLTAILETMPGAMLVLDEAGTLQKFNGAAVQLFGYAAGEVVGKRAELLMEDWQARSCPASADRQAGAFKYCGVGLRKDGSRFPMELVLAEWRSGLRPYFVGLAIDLTEKQHADARLQALQREMIHASRVSLMGTMASAMAHELNQPLCAITNYLKGLKYAASRHAEERQPDFTTILDKTADQALRAGLIIGRLRDLVAHGESERTFENIDRLIEDTSALAFPDARDHGVHVTVNHELRGELVLVDRVQIQQVILNLIRNATEAVADAGRREITISTAVADESMLSVMVADTGPGVASHRVPRLFEPFATTKRDGMGIGLFISRVIIESHGGKIWHEASPGGGAAFCFTLPRIAQDELDHAA